MREDEQSPIRVAYERRNRDLDPQLVWRGKDEQDWSDLVVHAPPLYIQEKIHPKILIDGLRKQTKNRKKAGKQKQLDLFSDFNGLPNEGAKTEFYQHEANWSNRMILGDSLQVMASLAEREGLRGKVQCIYIDPPYGIKFNSNFQWSTTSRDVKDGKTIVALHRAVFLARSSPDARVLLSTFSDTLANGLTTKMRRLISNEPRIAERLEVHAMKAIGRRIYELNFGPVQIASVDLIQQLLKEASQKVDSHKFSLHFLMAEWEQVVIAPDQNSGRPSAVS